MDYFDYFEVEMKEYKPQRFVLKEASKTLRCLNAVSNIEKYM